MSRERSLRNCAAKNMVKMCTNIDAIMVAMAMNWRLR